MKTKKIKKVISKQISKTEKKLYTVIAILFVLLVSSFSWQQYRYNKLRGEIWDKVESIVDINHSTQ